MAQLRLAIRQEDWTQRGKFPQTLKPLLNNLALQSIKLDEYDEHFFNYMPELFPYNKFTMRVSFFFLFWLFGFFFFSLVGLFLAFWNVLGWVGLGWIGDFSFVHQFGFLFFFFLLFLGTSTYLRKKKKQKLIKRTVFPDHITLLVNRQDEILEDLKQEARAGFSKAEEEWEKSVVAWG